MGQPQPLGHGATGSGAATNTFVVLYDYVGQRNDELQLAAGQLVHLLDAGERDWWKVCPLDGPQSAPYATSGYFPASYLAQLCANERPLQVAQTIQLSNGETCDKLLRGQVSGHAAASRHFRPKLNEAPGGGVLVMQAHACMRLARRRCGFQFGWFPQSAPAPSSSATVALLRSR